MKIIKNIFIGLGAVFFVLILVAVFTASSSLEFKSKHEKLVKKFSTEFSQTWDVDSVSLLMTNDLLSQVNSPNGVQATKQFHALGRLVEISDLELANYSSNIGTQNGSTGVFRFKGVFENATALVTVTIYVSEGEGEVKVSGFNINTI
ncbi:MAG: hypothetical protein GY931_07980, partial [Maribacter sp.]|nr:hypothetical protein [Maribacter sp.]